MLLGARRCRRGVSQILRRITTESSHPRTGVFGIPDLREPGDWFKLARAAVERCRSTIQEVALAPPSVQVIRLLDDISDHVCQVYDAAECCRNVHVDASWRRAAQQTCVELGGYVHELNNDNSLYSALVRALEHHDRIASHQQASSSDAQHRHAGQEQVIDGYSREALLVGKLLRRDFEKGGIHLADQARQTIADLTARIHQTGLQITNNITNEGERPLGTGDSVWRSNPWNDAHSPRELLYHASEAARERGYRQLCRTPTENIALMDLLAEDRHELAAVLGVQSYAHYALDAATLAGSPEAVAAFMYGLNTAIQTQMQEELRQLRQIKFLFSDDTSRGRPLQPWDKEFCKRLTRREIDAMLSSAADHFYIGSVLRGLKEILQRTFSLRMNLEEMLPGEAWAEGLIKLAFTHDQDGPLGHIYLDLLRRQHKFSGCAHFTLRSKRLLRDGQFQLPLIALVFNYSSRMLDPHEAETFFHEFGHALHSLLSRTEFQHLSGTRGALDMMEIPSHLFEHFLRNEECLRLCSRHHTTGDPLPEKVVKAFKQHWEFMPALKLNDTIVNAMVDQQFHGKRTGSVTQSKQISDTVAKFSAIQTSAEPETHCHLRFGHLVTYGASYYSYVYAKVIADAIWRKHFAEDPFSRIAGAAVRSQLLDLGGAKEPRLLIEDLLGPGSLQQIGAGWAPAIAA